MFPPPFGGRLFLLFMHAHSYASELALQAKVFSKFVVSGGLPAGFPTLPALFEGLCSCGGVSVDRNLFVILDAISAGFAT